MDYTKVKADITSYVKHLNRDKILNIMFQILIFSAFWGTKCLPFNVPGIGELFLFRVMIVVFGCYYVLDIIKRKYNPFIGRTKIEYTVFVLIISMLLCGFLSLVRAIDFVFTFRKFFNLSFDLAFISFIILFIDNKRKIITTVYNCLFNLFLLQIMGLYEMFFGGIFNDYYNDFKRYMLFNKAYQAPLVSFENMNNYSSTLLFILPFIICFLLIKLLNCKSKKQSLIYSSVIVINVILSFILVRSTKSRLSLVALYMVIIGVIIYIMVYQRKLFKVFLITGVSMLLILGMENYRLISIKVTNFVNIMKYEEELAFSSDGNVKKPVILEEPISNNISLEEEFVTTDTSGKQVLNINESGGVRLSLILFSMKQLANTKGLGVGLGNTEMLAKVVSEEQFGGIWSIHCFIARIIADMGIFVLIPGGMLIFLVFKELFFIIRKFYKTSIHNKIIILFLIISILCFPILSTAPSDAQDIWCMWISLAGIIIILRKSEGIFDNSLEVAENR